MQGVDIYWEYSGKGWLPTVYKVIINDESDNSVFDGNIKVHVSTILNLSYNNLLEEKSMQLFF